MTEREVLVKELLELPDDFDGILIEPLADFILQRESALRAEVIKTWKCSRPDEVIVVQDEETADALAHQPNEYKCGHPHIIIIGEVGVSEELTRLRSSLSKMREALQTASGVIKVLGRNNTSTVIDEILIEIAAVLKEGV